MLLGVTEMGGGPGAIAAAWTHTWTNGNQGGVDGCNCRNRSGEEGLNTGDAGSADDSAARWTETGCTDYNFRRHLSCFPQR